MVLYAFDFNPEFTFTLYNSLPKVAFKVPPATPSTTYRWSPRKY